MDVDLDYSIGWTDKKTGEKVEIDLDLHKQINSRVDMNITFPHESNWYPSHRPSFPLGRWPAGESPIRYYTNYQGGSYYNNQYYGGSYRSNYYYGGSYNRYNGGSYYGGSYRNYGGSYYYYGGSYHGSYNYYGGSYHYYGGSYNYYGASYRYNPSYGQRENYGYGSSLVSEEKPMTLVELNQAPKQPAQDNTMTLFTILMLVLCSIAYGSIKMYQRKRRENSFSIVSHHSSIEI